MSGDVILDISRLMSRARHYTPSGVDRVEMAYARGLLTELGEQLRFAAVHPLGRYGRVSRDKAVSFLDTMESRWAQEEGRVGQRPLTEVLPTLLTLWPEAPRPSSGSVYVQASPHHLTKPGLMRRILEREQAKFLCLVHDLIPIEYPEYARPSGAAQHRTRIETITSLADSILVNSTATGISLKPWIQESGRHIDMRVALLGTHEMPATPMATAPAGDSYFICIGTIEPRKNHLLLLNLWRRMAETLEPHAIPRLLIVGRRGWENEQVVDMLERCTALRGHVEEVNGCSDQRMYELLRGARALLLPSFAEGFGMPVTEALSVGTSVICSDLPSLREAAGEVPDFLDPLDGPAWNTHILDYFRDGPLQAAQAHRLSCWQAPSWTDHINILCTAIGDLQA